MNVSVLLIDSDTAHAAALAGALQPPAAGGCVVRATSIADARKRLHDGRFDAVVLCHRLHDGDCFDLLGELQGTPVLLAVEPGAEWAAARAMRLGCADYLVTDARGAALRGLRAQLDTVLQKSREMRRLRDNSEHFELAIASANVGLWEWNARTRRNTINTQWASMLGYAVEEIPMDASGWLGLVHPDDIPRIESAEEAGFKLQTSRYEVEFRMRHKDGGWRWIQSRGSILEFAADGTVLRSAGTQIDITARKEALSAFERQLQLVQAVNRAQAAFLSGSDAGPAFGGMLADLLALTSSARGFIAELGRGVAGEALLQLRASADPSAPPGDAAAAPGDAWGDLQHLLATVAGSREPWLRAGDAEGNPAGIPLAAIPICIGTEIVGVVGLADRALPYTPADVAFLAPLLGTIGQRIQADRSELLKRAAQQENRVIAELLAQKTQAMGDMLNSVSQGISLVSPDNRLAAYNLRYMELLELPESLLAPLPSVDRIVQFQTERGDFGETFALIDAEARGYVAEEYAGRPEGKEMPDIYLRKSRAGRVIEVRTRRLASGSRVRTFTDVTSYVASQTALRESELRFRSLTELITDWYWEQDAEGRFTKFEASREIGTRFDFSQMLGKTAQECRGFLVYRATAEQWAEWEALRARREEFREFVFPADVEGLAGLRYFAVSGLPMFDPRGDFTGYRGTGRDVTDRKEAEAEIERLAFYDALCNLPNRRLLVKRLAQALAASHRSGQHGALLFIDLDNFKDLNDTLGHAMGDALLRIVAQRLTACMREGDTVARFGGDEFVVMIENLSDSLAESTPLADATARKIMATLNQPYDLEGTQHHSTPSLGVTVFNGHRQSVDELLKRADMAMYQAKAAGRNVVRFFDPEMQAAVAARSALEADLRRGLQREELRLYYQPIVDIASRLTGVEALLRWQHPRRGLVPPVEFIPLAERTGLILPLGQWVLESACRQLALWAAVPETAPLKISVNVSARQFRQPEFVAQVLGVLQRTGASPHRLKIELTESMLLNDVEDVIDKMTQLQARGVGFSLDDFGTGYSSLSYLKRLPLDQLKIDKSFVRDVLTDPNDAAIARTILTLAHSLDLTVVAEGVENEGQRDFLARNGCREFQGYLFGKPVPVAQLRGIEQAAT